MPKEKTSEDWVRDSKKNNITLFSELDVLLRALDRFFSLDDLLAAKVPPSNKNFYGELNVVENGILRVLSILEIVIPESKKNAFWFQKFAETKFLTGRKRDLFIEEMYKQDTPEKSLYLLYDSFINLKTIVADLLKNNTIQYLSFKNIGHMISKQIRENLFFNPYRHDIDPELDFIDNKEITEIVKQIKDRDIKKIISVIFLQLFRFLRYMKHINHTTQRYVALHPALLILMLLYSEITLFRSYIEKVSGKIKDQNLVMLLQSLSYQFSMETKRVFFQELKDIFEKKSPRQLRGRIENSHGILKNLTEQAIIQLAQFWKPELTGEEVFEIFITKTGQSLKLREDIFVLHELLALVEKNAQSPKKRLDTLNSLRNFMEYFESFTFRLLRYDDYEEFSAFFEDIKAFDIEQDDFDKFLQKCQHFRIFLDTTLRQIANRAELKDKPLDTKKIENVIKQYLSNT
jgi:hypothetical protein